MAVSDYSTTPGSNASISGINIAENCPAGNLNGAVRQMMADIRTFYNGVPVAADFMAKTGGAFTAQITRNGAGGYLYNADAANTGGKIFTRSSGGPVPGGMTNGDFLVTFA